MRRHVAASPLPPIITAYHCVYIYVQPGRVVKSRAANSTVVLCQYMPLVTSLIRLKMPAQADEFRRGKLVAQRAAGA